jgi:hypothetical protein
MEQSNSYPALTQAGEEVRIVEKVADDQRGQVLVAENGSEYVLDYGTGLLIALEDAPVKEAVLSQMEPEGSPVTAPQGDPDEDE